MAPERVPAAVKTKPSLLLPPVRLPTWVKATPATLPAFGLVTLKVWDPLGPTNVVLVVAAGSLPLIEVMPLKVPPMRSVPPCVNLPVCRLTTSAPGCCETSSVSGAPPPPTMLPARLAEAEFVKAKMSVPLPPVRFPTPLKVVVLAPSTSVLVSVVGSSIVKVDALLVPTRVVLRPLPVTVSAPAVALTVTLPVKPLAVMALAPAPPVSEADSMLARVRVVSPVRAIEVSVSVMAARSLATTRVSLPLPPVSLVTPVKARLPALPARSPARVKVCPALAPTISVLVPLPANEPMLLKPEKTAVPLSVAVPVCWLSTTGPPLTNRSSELPPAPPLMAPDRVPAAAKMKASLPLPPLRLPTWVKATPATLPVLALVMLKVCTPLGPTRVVLVVAAGSLPLTEVMPLKVPPMRSMPPCVYLPVCRLTTSAPVCAATSSVSLPPPPTMLPVSPAPTVLPNLNVSPPAPPVRLATPEPALEIGASASSRAAFHMPRMLGFCPYMRTPAA